MVVVAREYPFLGRGDSRVAVAVERRALELAPYRRVTNPTEIRRETPPTGLRVGVNRRCVLSPPVGASTFTHMLVMHVIIVDASTSRCGPRRRRWRMLDVGVRSMSGRVLAPGPSAAAAEPLTDEYLRFLEGRCRPKTLLAPTCDLTVKRRRTGTPSPFDTPYPDEAAGQAAYPPTDKGHRSGNFLPYSFQLAS